MKITFLFAMMLLTLLSRRIAAQETDTTNIKELEKIRKESGIDPTRVSTRFIYGQEFLNPKGSGYSYNNTFKLNVGVGDWAFSLKTRARSTYTPGELDGTFSSGIDDFTFSAGNTVYYKGKHAINVGVEILAPVGSKEFGTQSFLMSPNFTYAYTISPKLIFAINPQYTFTVAKSDIVPAVSLATIRPFFAGFFQSGVFIVFEPRVLYNFKDKKLDMIISPILGKSLGKGWNIVAIVEAPVTNKQFETLGMMYKFGVQKNF